MQLRTGKKIYEGGSWMKGKYWMTALVLLFLLVTGIFLGRGSVLFGSAVLRGSQAGSTLGDLVLSRPQADGPVSGRLDLNTATAEQLQELPGVGPVLAQNILNLRQKLGGFTAVSQLLEADGLGAGIYDKIKNLVYIAQ